MSRIETGQKITEWVVRLEHQVPAAALKFFTENRVESPVWGTRSATQLTHFIGWEVGQAALIAEAVKANIL